MKATVVSAVALVVIAVAARQANADGKFYEQEKIPARIPYQRAFLVFHDGTEALAVQSKYDRPQSADANSIGWVAPVPSIPELASMEPEAASRLFELSAFRTSAEYRRVSTLFFIPGIVMLLSGLLLVLTCIVEIPPRWLFSLDMGRWSNRVLMGICATVLGAFVAALGTPTLGLRTDVEVVKAEQVGVYDVKVIKGDTAEPVMAWLTENGFHFGEPDKAVFADYVRRGWCFVVAKVGRDADPRAIAAEGMAAPLILNFRTDKPVYPLALTATAGAKTEVLLYTMSASKLVCGGRLPLRHARVYQSTNLSAAVWGESPPDVNMILCKFRGTLTPAQMKEDLVFEPAADNKSYRETKIIW